MIYGSKIKTLAKVILILGCIVGIILIVFGLLNIAKVKGLIATGFNNTEIAISYFIYGASTIIGAIILNLLLSGFSELITDTSKNKEYLETILKSIQQNNKE